MLNANSLLCQWIENKLLTEEEETWDVILENYSKNDKELGCNELILRKLGTEKKFS